MIEEFQNQMNKIFNEQFQDFVINKAKEITSSKNNKEIYNSIVKVLTKFSVMLLNNEYRNDFLDLIVNSIAMGMKNE